MGKSKSKVKAAGLKSVIHLDTEQIVMTNFTESPLELKIANDKISRITKTEAEIFDAKEKQNKKSTTYKIKSKRTPPLNDDVSKVEQITGEWHNTACFPDPLGLREKTLAKIFDNSDKITDNLHIQVAQQILDFKKLFAVYANHLEHIFNNMGGIYKNECKDSKCEFYQKCNEDNKKYGGATYAECDWLSQNFIENKGIKKLLCEFKLYRINAKPYMTYFRIKYEPLKDITDANKFDDDLYVMVSAVSMLRNAITHTEPKAPDYILKPNEIPCQILKKMKAVLNNHLLGINANFTEKNSKTLQILHLCDPKYSAQEFYNFTMRQDHKNLGFSIRILREKLLEKNPIDISDKKTKKDNPTEKARVNKVLDFIIWQKLKDNKKAYQEDLRATTSEEEKEAIYSKWANQLKLSKEIEKIQEAIDEIQKNNFNKNNDIKEPVKFLGIDDFSPFSIYVYYLCRCLGGHEINELLTGLIHKFENISSFKQIWKSLGNKAMDFKTDFSLFGNKNGGDNCKKLSDEIRLLNGFVRMSNLNKKKKLDSKKDPTFGREHWWHLAQVLETTKEIGEIEAQVKDNHPLRNFISKNALESRRFQYLIKYANPESVRKFAKQNIFEFALRQIPEAQMKRYYPNFAGGYTTVAEELLRIKWDTFADLSSNNKDNYIGKLRLYFTVLYLIVKNLVNINSRYVMALWRLDFDKELCTELICDRVSTQNKKCKSEKCDKICVTDKCLENLESKYAQQQKSNINLFYGNEPIPNIDITFCPEMFARYRNTIAHQNAIQFKGQSNIKFEGFSGKEKLRSSSTKKNNDGKITKQSYFALYHYMVQKCIKENFPYNDYSKDLLKILNTPFAYNHGRYNALSVEHLFDKNDIKEKEDASD